MELGFAVFAIAATAGVGLFCYLVYSFRPTRRGSRRSRSSAQEPPRYF